MALHTPYSVHIGTAPAIQDKRQAVPNAARAANRGASPAAPQDARRGLDQQAGHQQRHYAASTQGGSLENSRNLCLI